MARSLVSSTVLDAGVLIGFVKSDDSHHRDAVEALAKIAAAGEEMVLCAVTFAELMAGAYRRGPKSVRHVLQVVDTLPRLRIVPADRRVSTYAARIRARSRRLGLADAFVVATAAAEKADRILTTDHGFDDVPQAVRLADFAHARRRQIPGKERKCGRIIPWRKRLSSMHPIACAGAFRCSHPPTAAANSRSTATDVWRVLTNSQPDQSRALF
ncbi:MAG: PIN domain-containing protein [Actinobacteria bacterium]|nr:PIN domain-containing protein [Actinomycetota bacterium]